MLVLAPVLLRVLTGSFAAALAIWPFIFVRKPQYLNDPILIYHERIHLRQQIELLILPFYIWYGVEFLYHYAICRNKLKAYKNISFEREAFLHEKNKNYLATRKCWAFINYVSSAHG